MCVIFCCAYPHKCGVVFHTCLQGKAPGLIGWWPQRAVTFVDNHGACFIDTRVYAAVFVHMCKQVLVSPQLHTEMPLLRGASTATHILFETVTGLRTVCAQAADCHGCWPVEDMA